MSNGRRLAICIGINHYDNIRPLSYSVADATEIAVKFEDRGIGNFDKVKLITDDRDEEGKVIPVTKKRIETGMNWLFKENKSYNPEDLLLIYYSGHSEKDKSNNLVLLPSDTQRNEDRSLDLQTGYSLTALEDFILSCTARNIIIMIDACHSGAGGQLPTRLNKLPDDYNLFIIGAAQSEQLAYGGKDYGHGYFTHCLLNAFNQRPEAEGWITIKQAERIVQKDLARLEPELRALGKLLQEIKTTTSSSRDINLVKNPLFDQDSEAFRREVERALELKGYTILPFGTHDDSHPPGFFKGQIEEGLVKSTHGIYCLDNEKLDTPAEILKQVLTYLNWLARDKEITSGILVTRRPLNGATINALGIAPDIKLFTLTEILGNLINFDRYIGRVIDEYKRNDPERQGEPLLSQIYVPLKGEERGYFARQKGLNLILAPEVIKLWGGDLETKVREWLADENPENSRLVLIGDYGSGKSTFCRHLSYSLVKEYRDTTVKTGKRIPILLPLREFVHGAPRIEDFLIAHLKRRCNVNNPDYLALREMAKAGLLLFIFDGFDEMAVRSDEETLQQNIHQIGQLVVPPGSKILLTTRPEYFLKAVEENEILSNFQPLYLTHFDPEQVDLFLQKRVPLIEDTLIQQNPGHIRKSWQEYKRDINNIHDLRDLQRRAVLLEMIIKTLPELISSKAEVDRPNLYYTYLLGELKRQTVEKMRKLLIPREQRLEMMETLAANLFLEGKSEISADRAWTHLKKGLTRNQREQGEAHKRDFLTSSFLFRVGDNYQFSHQSFQEYLIARRLKRELDNGDINTTFAKKVISPTIADFLAELKPPTEELTKLINNLEYGLILFENIAQLLLSSHLLRLNKLENGVEIDPELMTRAEYQLFLDDKAKVSSDYRPDHWLDTRFEPGQATYPALGIRAKDVQEFVQWLSQRYSSQYYFRLPSLDEVKVNSLQENGVWYRDNDGLMALSTNQNDNRSLLSFGATEVPVPANYKGITLNYEYHLLLNSALKISLILANPFVGLLNNSFEIASDLDRDIDLDLTRILDIARAFDLHFNVLHDLTRGRALDRALDIALSRSRARVIAIILDIARRLDIARDLAFDRIFDLALNLASDLDIAHDLALTRAQDLASARDLELQLAHRLNLARDLAKDLNDELQNLIEKYNLSFLCYKAFSSCLKISPEYYEAFLLIAGLLVRGQGINQRTNNKKALLPFVSSLLILGSFGSIQEAIKLISAEIERFQKSENPADIKKANILTAIQGLLSGESENDLRKSLRQFMKLFAEYAYEGLGVMSHPPEEAEKYEKAKELMAELYWWTVIVDARQEGKLLAWEGIRIVRERRDDVESINKIPKP